MKKRYKLSGYIIPIVVALFNILILLYPKEIIGAAKEGVTLWFNNVFPSLLPFIIGANILSGLGVTSFIGALLEPVMYPLFRVPGCAGFALAVGMTSGYPMGAKVTSDLKRDGFLSDDEAQRLAGFCNNSGPLFILGAIGVSMLNNTQAGYFILIIHYAAAITTGLIFRFYKYDKGEKRVYKKRVFLAAVKSMRETQRKDGRRFGELLGDGVKNAMETILTVGGFIILFCVIVRALEITGITDIVIFLCKDLVPRFTEEMYKGVFAGIVEMTNGARLIAAADYSEYSYIIAAGIVSFGGMSVTAQSASFFSKSGIKVSIYIFSKLLHAAITIIYGFVLFPLFNFDKYLHVSSMLDGGFIDKFIYSLLYFGLTLLLMLALIFISFFYKAISDKK